MSLPSLDALLATGLPVIACARPWAQDFLAAYKLAGFVPMHSRWYADARAVRKARRAGHYASHLGLLLPDSLTSALSFRLAGISSAGYRDDGRSPLLRWAFKKPAASLHAVESWYHLSSQALNSWGLVFNAHTGLADNLDWLASTGHIDAARQALVNARLAAGKFILIAPTATGLHQGQIKVWPHFERFTQAMQAHGYTVVMAPPPAERQAAVTIAPSARLIESMGLGAFTAFTRFAALVVCNDSGVSHLAAAAQARQITLFGVTNPKRTGPWSAKATCLGQDQAWPALDQVIALCLQKLGQSVKPFS